ncbi:MAG TPA: DUF5666 domain-containing protein [Terracidiphilus sp.]|nr:DUF5666 domain-containing protein [Terracidiphilus sp.]
MGTTSVLRVRGWLVHMVLVGALLAALPAAFAQAPTRFLGSITAISGNNITIKTSTGDVHQFEVPSSAPIRRIEPGQTSLSNAVTIPLSDLAVGDRLLVLLNPNAGGGTPQASEIVAIKHEDVVKRQEQQSQAWAEGVGGLVKSVDPASGTIVLAAGSGLATKSVTVHTAPSTVLKRYAPASVSYAQATPAPITDIHPGDQLMARGTKNSDGTELTAQEVVSGSFRNISGLISSVDDSNQTISVKDLLTKKPVTIHITPEAQMRQLPERMAQFIAMRLKGQMPGGMGGGRGGPGGGPGRGGNGRPENGGGGEGGMRPGGPGMAGGGPREMNPQQILSRAPEIKFSDLKKSEAVMLVATQGASDVTAITLIAGVEPLLEAPASQDLLSSWSMNNGSGAADSEGGGGGSQ